MMKLIKMVLMAAVLSTGAMAQTEYDGGNLVVIGTVNQNKAAAVSGTITVNDGGTFNNNTTLTFKENGGLSMADGTKLLINDYKTANTTYSLGVTAVGNYSAGKVIGRITNINADNVESAKFDLELSDLALDATKYTLSNLVISNIVGLTPTDVAKLPSSNISWQYSDASQSLSEATAKITWSKTVQTQENFIAAVKTAIDGNGDVPEDVQTKLKNGTTTGGTFNNASGTLDFTEAGLGSTFSGSVNGGIVTLKDTTKADLTSLKVIDITANYAYALATNYSAPTVGADEYITVKKTDGKSTEDAEKECKDKFATDSVINKFNGAPYSGDVTDDRKDFPAILADGTLNATTSKLKTSEISDIVKDYNAGTGLNVNDTINIQFEGSDALKFATGDDGVITFAGDNSKFTGATSFADDITKVVASDDNTLPVKLSGMDNIDLDITGENTINASSEVTVQNLKLNTGSTLTIAAGTTLNVGAAG